ncbi:MAG: hypothetical protein Q8O19_04725, partial [Rectinemataceae bacterium]|nr:hypothetical protein [Rectinemataceae bacterium]
KSFSDQYDKDELRYKMCPGQMNLTGERKRVPVYDGADPGLKPLLCPNGFVFIFGEKSGAKMVR